VSPAGSAVRRGLLAAALVVAPAAARADFWIQAIPQGAAEEALRAAVAETDRDRREQALKDVAAAHAGTPASGLAWLALGMAYTDAKRYAEAEAALQQPDIKRTAVADRALVTLARAREAAGQDARAAQTYDAVLEAHPQTPLLCDVLSQSADAWSRTPQRDQAPARLERVLNECPGYEPSALLRLGQYHESRGRLQEAADYYDRLDCDYPDSPRSAEGARRLAALKGKVAPLAPATRYARDLRKAVALSDASRHKQAAPLLRSLLARTPPTPADGEIVRMRLARALVAMDRDTDALQLLQVVSPASVFGAEAAFLRARVQVQREKRPQAYETVVAGYPGTMWAEEALLTLANHYLKDARYAEAVPYFQRLLAGFPDGRYLERASWWTGWWEYRSGRMEAAAAVFESVADTRRDSLSTAGALYWAARARQRMGDEGRARGLFEETVKRWKHTYHGLRAGEALGLLRAGASSTHPSDAPRGGGGSEVPEPQRTRVRELLMVNALDAAEAELQPVSSAAEAQATSAWILWKQGKIRAAITAMRRAYPDWRSEKGDRLPFAVWRILYPLDYEEALVARAGDEGLDAALVAALIWQESAFDAQAQSAVGARGLMQIMPSTGRMLARQLRAGPVRPQDLYDPARNLQFGTRYLDDMIDRFGGHVERALAAYNAGPTRVVRWTAGRADMSAEEFIENIPFAETRTYVTNILAHREHYRRLYSLPEKPPPGLTAALVPAPPAPEARPAKADTPKKKSVARKASAPRKSSVRKGSAQKARASTAKKKAPRRRSPR
jgi:soluble lytic murein transglycosylase